MADRTYMQLEILECPAQNVGRVLDRLWAEGFTGDTAQAPTELELGKQYTNESAPLGTLLQTLADQLSQLCSFTGWEDPCYEYPGEGIISLLEDQDVYTFDCFRDGVPTFTEEAIRKALHDDKLAALFGDDRTTRLQALRQQIQNPTLLRPADCARHGGPWGEDKTCRGCTDDDGLPKSIT